MPLQARASARRSANRFPAASRAARSLAERRDRSAGAKMMGQWNVKRVVVRGCLAAAMMWLAPVIYDMADESLLWSRATPPAKPGSSYCLRWGSQHVYCYSSLGGIHKQRNYDLPELVHHAAQQGFATPAAAPSAAAALQLRPQAQLSGSHCAVSLGISLSQPRGLS